MLELASIVCEGPTNAFSASKNTARTSGHAAMTAILFATTCKAKYLDLLYERNMKRNATSQTASNNITPAICVKSSL